MRVSKVFVFVALFWLAGVLLTAKYLYLSSLGGKAFEVASAADDLQMREKKRHKELVAEQQLGGLRKNAGVTIRPPPKVPEAIMEWRRQAGKKLPGSSSLDEASPSSPFTPIVDRPILTPDHRPPPPPSTPVAPPSMPSSSSSSSSSSSGNSKCPGGFIPLTYATHGGKDDRFCRSVRSALQHDLPLRILGWGTQWKGLTQKFTGSHAFLLSLPPDCIVLFNDAFDVLYGADAETIQSRYRSAGSGVLFSAECGCWPQITRDRGKGDVCLVDYPKSPTPYRYLNSGQWIMEARDAAPLFETLISEAGTYAERYGVEVSKINDQEMSSDMYMAGRMGIHLDHDAKLFQAMHATHDRPLAECDPWKDIKNDGRGGYENVRTGGRPVVFHFNGGGKMHHLKMEASMWYMEGGVRGDRVPKTSREIKDSVLTVGDGEGVKKTFAEICPGFEP